MTQTAIAQDFAYCLELLRDHARDFYLANLLLPEKVRLDIAALHAFHVEITNITLGGGEPLARQMRLQWWQEAISGSREEEASGNPVTRALLDCIQRHALPVDAFANKLEAHIFDLYNDPMGDRSMFEGYCGETRSSLFQLAALIAGAEPGSDLADACGHAGVAAGIIAVLENMGHHHQHGQVFVPQDLLTAAGMNAVDYLAEPNATHINVVNALVDWGWEHHRKALVAIEKLPRDQRGIFKLVSLNPLYLMKISKLPSSVFTAAKPPSQIHKQWELWRF